MERLAAVLPDPPTMEEAAGLLSDGAPLSCEWSGLAWRAWRPVCLPAAGWAVGTAVLTGGAWLGVKAPAIMAPLSCAV